MKRKVAGKFKISSNFRSPPIFQEILIKLKRKLSILNSVVWHIKAVTSASYEGGHAQAKQTVLPKTNIPILELP